MVILALDCASKTGVCVVESMYGIIMHTSDVHCLWKAVCQTPLPRPEGSKGLLLFPALLPLENDVVPVRGVRSAVQEARRKGSGGRPPLLLARMQKQRSIWRFQLELERRNRFWIDVMRQVREGFCGATRNALLLFCLQECSATKDHQPGNSQEVVRRVACFGLDPSVLCKSHEHKRAQPEADDLRTLPGRIRDRYGVSQAAPRRAVSKGAGIREAGENAFDRRRLHSNAFSSEHGACGYSRCSRRRNTARSMQALRAATKG